MQQQITDNLARVRERIAAATTRAGRSAGDVGLVAVTKYVGPAAMRALLDAGCLDLGESRVQQLRQRVPLLGGDPIALDDAPAGPAPRWHMVGHLQRNKVKDLLPDVRIVHSLDSIRLADQVEKLAAEHGVVVEVLVEVNVAGEASKSGVPLADLEPLVSHAASLSHLRVRGLMTMAPYEDDPERTRPHFARLAAELARLRERGLVETGCRHLSMGMSNDYAVAVEEGATLVRIGSALFEGVPAAELNAE